MWCEFADVPEWYALSRLCAIWKGEDARREWRRRFGDRMPTPEEAINFYSSWDGYPYDLLATSVVYQQREGWPEALDPWIDPAPEGWLLDFGCGLGVHGLWHLMRGERQVALEDLPHRGLAFCRWQASKWYPTTEGMQWEVGAPFAVNRLFSVILAMQVLEHVHDPIAMAARLIERLAPKGRLMTCNHFPTDNPVPERPPDILHLRTGVTGEGFCKAMEERFGLKLLNEGSRWCDVWEKPE
jgi:SAM-dependent methyltransferase